jgi:hypothetical protein
MKRSMPVVGSAGIDYMAPVSCSPCVKVWAMLTFHVTELTTNRLIIGCDACHLWRYWSREAVLPSVQSITKREMTLSLVNVIVKGTVRPMK